MNIHNCDKHPTSGMMILCPIACPDGKNIQDWADENKTGEFCGECISELTNQNGQFQQELCSLYEKYLHNFCSHDITISIGQANPE